MAGRFLPCSAAHMRVCVHLRYVCVFELVNNIVEERLLAVAKQRSLVNFARLPNKYCQLPPGAS